MKIGVIAGTPVDTRMGADYVSKHGHEVAYRASSPSPEIQTQMQILHPAELTEQVIMLCKEMVEEGCGGIYVNCNSMSAAIDLPHLRRELSPIPVVTPFDVYEECAHNYKRLSIIAANAQSLVAIEKVIAENNPECVSFGAGLLPLVSSIEARQDPDEIMRNLGMNELLYSFEAMKCDALILGCTHFPYVLDQIRQTFHMPIVDPNLRMLQILLERMEK